MASPLHKFLRKSTAARIIATLSEPPRYNSIPPFVIHKPHIGEIKPDGHGIFDPSLFSCISGTELSTSSLTGQIYSSLPFGLCSSPVMSKVSAQFPVQSEEENEGLNDSGKVWADSVKKKRKKKMNKHKYRKLRKRLRRQT